MQDLLFQMPEACTRIQATMLRHNHGFEHLLRTHRGQQSSEELILAKMRSRSVS